MYEEIIEEEPKQEAQPEVETPADVEKKKKDPKQKKRIQVVKELPVQQVKEYVDEDGVLVELITVEEALTKLFETE